MPKYKFGNDTNLMEAIAGQVAKQDAKYPRPNRTAKGNSGLYYKQLGVDIGDNWAAAQAMQQAQKVYRNGGPMPRALAKLIEQSQGNTRTTPMLVSQLPAAVQAREASRLARGTVSNKGDQSRINPAPAELTKVGPKGDAEAQAAAAIEGSGWKFKGTKLPLEDDINLVLKAEGKDRAEGYNAFVKAFGQDAADEYLNAKEGDD